MKHHLSNHALALLTPLVACSSTVVREEGADGPCVERSGSYIVRFTQRSGTCGTDGEVAESVVNVDDTTKQAVADNCTGDIINAEDNCSVQVTITCKRDDLGRGWTALERGKVTWSRDGSSASGTEQLSIFRGDGIQECTSVMDVTWTRQ